MKGPFQTGLAVSVFFLSGGIAAPVFPSEKLELQWMGARVATAVQSFSKRADRNIQRLLQRGEILLPEWLDVARECQACNWQDPDKPF